MWILPFSDIERKQRNRLSKEDALVHMQKFCAYQDRCHKEVRTRLIEHQVYGDDLEDIITDLITEDFLNEERFARSYVRGKFRMKKWGRIKIMKELKFRYISPYCIKKGMTEIDEEEYYDTLYTLIEKKIPTVNSKDYYDLRKKLTAYALQKGYEYAIINEVLTELVKK